MRSNERILTTHAGSLPRAKELRDLVVDREHGEVTAGQDDAIRAVVETCVHEIVRRQSEVGLDLVSDGELSKIGYATYVRERLTGFEGVGGGITIWDLAELPELAQRSLAGLDPTTPACSGPVSYRGHAALQTDIGNLTAAVQAAGDVELFLTAASPGVIATYLPNGYFADEDEYLTALAEAMREEYEAIAAAGLVVQIDAPDLAMGLHVGPALLTVPEFQRVVARRVELIDQATRNIAPEQIRLHLCWGDYAPHHLDVPLQPIVDLVLDGKAQAVSFEAANPQHEHHWRVFEEVQLPEDKVLVRAGAPAAAQ